MNLPYKINDIKTILNLKNDEIIKKELNKIKAISISDDDHINVTDIKSFMIEYKNAINRVTNMYHHT